MKECCNICKAESQVSERYGICEPCLEKGTSHIFALCAKCNKISAVLSLSGPEAPPALYTDYCFSCGDDKKFNVFYTDRNRALRAEADQMEDFIVQQVPDALKGVLDKMDQLNN